MTLRKLGILVAVGVSLALIMGAAPSKTAMKPGEPKKTSAGKTTPSTRTVSTTPRSISTSPKTPVVIDTPDPAPQRTGAATYDIPWSSINAGGAPSSSTNYSVNASVGQSAIGFATSTNYQAGIGYWYGAEASGGGCSCPFQADFNADGSLDSVDLNALIRALFFNGTNPQDPDCPTTRGDFDNNGVPDSTDLNLLILHLFFNGPGPTDPCV